MAIAPSDPPLISLVVPMYNEEDVVDRFFDAVSPILDGLTDNWEIICVDDGSRDETYGRLSARRKADQRIRLIRLSRNFGKELALTAGLDFAKGRAVIPIDADLQDPPSLIPEMLEKWREGFDVVLAKRAQRKTDTPAKRVTARAFYYLLQRLSRIDIPESVGDFRLMDRRVVEAVKLLPERSRFMKGIFAWLGFRQTVIEYDREERADGAAKQNWLKLFTLAVDGLVSFSDLPLKVWSYIGLTVALASGGYGGFIILRTLAFGIDAPGYASLMTAILFMNGLLLLGLGVIGEYVARIFVEVKHRPLYLIEAHEGVEIPDSAAYARLQGTSAAQRPELHEQKHHRGDDGDEDNERLPIRSLP